MKRRSFIGLGATGIALLSGASAYAFAARKEGDFEIVKTEEQWREVLSEEEFAVLRQEATERAFSSPLNDEKRAGIYHCAGCDLPVYSSETKFDSGTGWPSFTDSLPNAVATKTDYKLIYPRTEVHCRRCGGHLGHIFDDGPEPTGKRHCLNGIALQFKPAEI